MEAHVALLVCVCIQIVRGCGNTHFGTNDPEDRDDNVGSGSGTGHLMSGNNNWIVDCCGIVDRWQANFDLQGTGSSDVYFQVWRPTTGDTYELVGENLFSVTSDGERSINIAQASRITVKSGDKWGWWTSGIDVIMYENEGGANNNWLLNIADLNAGDTQDWVGKTVNNNRKYGVRMDVQSNNNPTFSNLPSSTSITRNTASGVSLFTVAVDDIDTYDVSTLSVMMTANAQFSFNTSSLVLSTSTITSTGTTTELLELIVSDQCTNSATATYTVTIVNQPPTINNLPNSTTLREDTTFETLLHTIDVTDPDDIPTCAMASSVPASYPFLVRQIPSTTDYGIYSASSPGFDYNVKTSYALDIDCTDSASTDTEAFTVYLVQNSPPVIANLQNATSVNTTTTVGSVAFTVISTDAEGDTLNYNMTCSPSPCPFTIFASGAILVSEDLSNHTTVGYDLFITVTDSRNSDGPKTLTITIADINDPVLISNLPLSAALSVPENTALGTSVYTVSYTDQDTSQTITLTMTSLTTGGASYFSIDTSSGLISTSGSVINYEALGSTSFTFDVSASDPVSSDTQSVVIDIIDLNEAPVFSPTAYSLSANESGAGTSVGTPSFGITDQDTGDSVTYTMDCGSVGSYFLMNSASGAVTFQSDYDLDSGSLPSIVTCAVTATDTGGLTSTANLTINIDNINDNTPTFLPSAYTFYISYYSSVGTTVGTVTATDGDTGAFGTLSYSIDQASLGAAYFAVDTSGVISIVTAPAGSSALNYSTSSVIIAKAIDGGALTATASVTIIVSDTTTTSSTTTTNSYQTFFDDPHNWAWFVPCMILLLVIFCLTCWVAFTCRGEQGCKAVGTKLCRKRRMKVDFNSKDRSISNKRDRYRPKDSHEMEEQKSVRNAPPPASMQAWRKHRF